jgi:uncharacterized membrane-anchored protein YjiN (DUF445 family)
MTQPDPDAAARRDLTRHKRIATALLLGMGGLTLGTHWMPRGWATDLLRAAATAGFVGGLADWFAVTALFRHPLGLPIPHTAIIPNQKARLGQALGRFVANHVITTDEVSSVLSRLDVPGILARYLSDPASARPAAIAIASLVPRFLTTLEDGRARRVTSRLIPRMLGGPGASAVVARALRGLVEGGRHQEVFGFILEQLKALLAAREETLRHAIEERVREQGGRLLGWALGASIARRVLTTINSELDKMSPDGSELRDAFDEWIRREIARMEDDPARAAEIGAALRRFLAHETVRVWARDVWDRASATMAADARKPNGRTVLWLEGALRNLGTMLETDQGVRARVESAVTGITAELLPAARANLSDFIARVVGNWDAGTITDRLEVRVGKDLQYVRMNGTLVGFLAGGAVFALLRLAFGADGF